MAKGEAKLSVTMSLVDKATTPLKKINESLKKTFEPVTRIKNGLKIVSADLGIPKISKAFGGVKKSVDGVVKEVKGLAKELAVVGGLAAGFLGGMAVTTANAGDEAYKAAQKVGLTTKAWGELSYAADMSGVSSDTLKTGLTRLNKQIIDASRGSKEAQYWFNGLGVSIHDQNGKLKDSETVFAEVTEALGEIENELLRTQVAAGIFGKAAGPEMMPLLNTGVAGIAELRAEAHRLGIVFTDEEGQAAEFFNDSLARVKYAVKGLSFAIGNQLIPLFSPWLDDLQQLITANRKLVASKVKEWIEELRAKWPELRKELEAAWEKIKDVARSVSELVEKFGGWAEVLPVVGAAIAGLKLAPLAGAVWGLGKAVLGLGTALLTTPIGWVALGIAGLVAGFLYLWDTSEGFRNFWTAMWDKVKSYVADAVDSIKASFDQGLVQGILNIFARFNPLALITAAISGVIDYVANLDFGFEKVIDDALAAILGFQPITLIKEKFGEVESYISNTWNSVTTSCRDTWDGVTKVLSDAWEDIKAIFAPVVAWFDEKIAKIKDAFDVGFLAGVREILKQFSPITWITDALDAVSNYIFGFKLTDAGESLIQSLWDGLKSMWEKVKEWILEIPKAIGSLIPESLLNTIDKVTSFASDVTGKASEIAGKAGDMASGIVDDAWGGLKSVGGSIRDFFSGSKSEETSPIESLIPKPELGEPLGVAAAMRQDIVRREEMHSETRSETLRDVRVKVEFDNVPDGVQVKSQGAAETKVSKGLAAMNPAYMGWRMGF